MKVKMSKEEKTIATAKVLHWAQVGLWGHHVFSGLSAW